MENKTKYLIWITILVIGLLVLPVLVKSEEDYIDTNALTIIEAWQENGNLTDGKVKMLIRVTSAPTNTYSGGTDLVYFTSAVIDIAKPERMDEKITNNVRDSELGYGRNLTNISIFSSMAGMGIQGIQGIQGVPGINGTDGYSPIKGIDYFDGINGTNGIDGVQGIQGIQGIPGINGSSGNGRFTLAASWDVSATKSNIGTVMIDIYNTVNSNGKGMLIDTTGLSKGRVLVQWNKIGTGNQQLRVIDNTSSVLFTMPVISGANDYSFNIPTGQQNVTRWYKLQASSTVSGDDPVFESANILMK